jgi:hypothetical protein
MRTLSRTLVLLLLAAVITLPVAAHGLLVDAAAAYHPPAGCHEDAGSIPAPAPASHNCCQLGHHPAILPASSAPRPPLQISAPIECSQDVPATAAFNFPSSLVIESGGPPVMSPLRV